jgi:sensor histidine kinase YesM
MGTNVHIWLLFALLVTTGLCTSSNAHAQKEDTIIPIHLPLSKEDLSLYDFAEVRFETHKKEKPPGNLIKRSFRLVHDIFPKDSLYFADSVQSVWFKFTLKNNDTSDAAIALQFPYPGSVNKAVLYEKKGEDLILIGKTGWFIAVNARMLPDEWSRIDIPLKAMFRTTFYLQIPRTGFLHCPKSPVLKTIAYADMEAYDWVKKVQRPGLLWTHFFTGIFFMFFLFGFIKYLVLGRDKAYLYYALLGLSNTFLTIAQGEYPALELPWFEDVRGIELFNFVNGISILMQGLFILEILQLRIKYPRITIITKLLLFLQLLIETLYTISWIAQKTTPLYGMIYPYKQSLLLLMMLSWVLYLWTIRKGFYRYIFLGALTIFIAFTFCVIIQNFNLFHLLPAWVATDPRGSVNHFMQIALVIDMCFYFAGLAYRDRQVLKEKSAFQEQLITQLEANKRLQQKFTSELEQQVEEKTAELIEQRKAVETQKEAKLLAEFDRKFSESELKALRSQMNPHFVFNILNTIESYSLENNKEAVSDMIQKFSKLTRLVLENSMSQLVPFENDWKSLQLYIELEQMRYTDKFLVVYSVEDQIREQEFFIPPMIIQPFVENAIIHGLRNKAGENGILDLSASLQNGYIVVQVKDNGIGRSKSAQLKANNPIQKKSLGIKVTQDRISIFNNLNHDKKAKVEIQDLSEGTSVLICLPATN